MKSSLSERRRELAVFNPDIDRHARLLAFLDRHPLVRRIELPGIVVRAAGPSAPRTRPVDATIPVRDSRRTHPGSASSTGESARYCRIG